MNKRTRLAVGSVAAAIAVATTGYGVAQAGPSAPNTGHAATPATAVAPHAMPGTAQVLFGVVNSNGTLARGYGATTAVHVGTGLYEVQFTQNVRACSYTATVGLSGSVGISTSGEATVVGANDSVYRVYVTTSASNGALSDRGFHLTVAC